MVIDFLDIVGCFIADKLWKQAKDNPETMIPVDEEKMNKIAKLLQVNY